MELLPWNKKGLFTEKNSILNKNHPKKSNKEYIPLDFGCHGFPCP